MDGKTAVKAEDFGDAIAVSTGPVVNKSHLPAKNNRDGPTCGVQVRAVIDAIGAPAVMFRTCQLYANNRLGLRRRRREWHTQQSISNGPAVSTSTGWNEASSSKEGGSAKADTM